MAKVTAPLLGFDARGQIGKTQVYGRWKGIPYARKHTIPANPRSTDQMKTRDSFGFLSNVWKVAPADFRTPWQQFVKGKPLTDRNAFFSKNVGLLRTLSDLTGLVMSPGAAGGLSGSVSITPGNDLLTIDGTPPDVMPPGWSIVKFVGAAIRQQDSHGGVLFDVVTGSDDTDPYSVVLTGLASAEHYVAAGWFVYQRSSLATDLAYGPAVGADYLTT